MEISTAFIHSAQNLQGTHRLSTDKNISEVNSRARSLPQDSISFSDEALRLSQLTPGEGSSSSVRFDLVNRIKSEIDAGTYDTSDKMDIAIERMASKIFS